MKSPLKPLMSGIKAHKILTAIIAVTVVVGGIGMVSAAKKSNAATQYTVSPAMVGNIVQTVSGSGQVSASNQIDVTSLVSGAITSIPVSVGQHVNQGQLIATIDSTNALNSLQSAKLSLAQLVEPAKQADLDNSQNSLQKAYSDAQSSIRSAFTDLQTVMPGLEDLFYARSGFLGTPNAVFLDSANQQYRTTAAQSYDAAKAAYQDMLARYSDLSPQSSTSTIEQAVSDTYSLLQEVATAIKNGQAAITYTVSNQPTYLSGNATTAKSDTASWLSLVNSDVASLATANNSIATDKNALSTLVTGADALQVQSSELAVAQAQRAYDQYFIRAPFDGTVGKIPVSIYSQAGSGTVIATIIGDNKVANITLDEVDAAKVKVGQPAQITFDAIDGFVATGTVSEADLVGTVSQGVVSYGVKIAVATQDDRIRPGMSVNTQITTARKDGVLIVPNAAVKTANGRSYVQVLDASALPQRQQNGPGAQGAGNASSTMRVFTASSTRPFAGRSISFTISSAAAPHDVDVTTGLSDDQNTEITEGLSPRELVVTKSSSGSSSAAAPSILNAIGGNRAGGAGGAPRGNIRIGG